MNKKYNKETSKYLIISRKKNKKNSKVNQKKLNKMRK